MNDFSPSDLKTILHSKRANMYYLEYCRVMQKDGRVLYLTEAQKENQYFNIPIANSTIVLLGIRILSNVKVYDLLTNQYFLLSKEKKIHLHF